MRSTPLLSRTRALAICLALLAPLAATQPALADQVADKRAEAARLAESLEEQGRKVSVLTEEVNQARLRADEVAAQARVAQERTRDTDRRVAQARARLKGHAVASYVEGGQLPAVQAMVSGSTDDLAVRTVYVKEVAGRQRTALEDLRAARQDLEEQRDKLEAAQRSAKDALSRVESRQQAAAQAAGAQEDTLRRVQGEVGSLVAAETQRRADEESRRAQSEVAALQARTAGPRAPAGAAPGRGGGTGPGAVAPPGPNAGPPASGAAAAVAEARRQLGKPYRWGAAGPDSFDCSGLTLWAWRAGGRSLPHSSRAQFSATRRVALGDIQPGDLVFYGSPIHHMGIYVGGGTMVEASQTGTPVRYASIYRRDMAGVGRVS